MSPYCCGVLYSFLSYTCVTLISENNREYAGWCEKLKKREWTRGDNETGNNWIIWTSTERARKRENERERERERERKREREKGKMNEMKWKIKRRVKKRWKLNRVVNIVVKRREIRDMFQNFLWENQKTLLFKLILILFHIDPSCKTVPWPICQVWTV